MITITAEDFARAARELQQAGRKDLRREMFKALNRSTKPARAAVLAGLEDYLPDNYAAELRRGLSLSATAKGGKDPAVRIRARGRRKGRFVGPLNQGRLRHPAWGRDVWFDQAVRPGFFTGPLHDQRDDVRRRLEDALATVAAEIAD